MIAIEGSTTVLTCPLQGWFFKWKKWTNSDWSILQQGAKYRNVTAAYLVIYNVDPHDGGTYLCTTGRQKIKMKVVFRGTQSKLEKCSQTTIKCICIKMKLVKNFRKNEILTVILCMLVSDLSVMFKFTQCSTHAIQCSAILHNVFHFLLCYEIIHVALFSLSIAIQKTKQLND